MTDWSWVWEDGALVDHAHNVAIVGFEEGEIIPVNWSMWKRWFHSNTGIGSSQNLWIPSRKGPSSAWVLCDRCGLPFEIPTGFYMSSVGPAGGPELIDIEWTGGPCTRCKEVDGVIATGQPVIHAAMDGHRVVAIAGSAENAQRAWELWADLTTGLDRGDLSVTDVAARLRDLSGPLSRLADWLENRPVTATTAGVLITAIASLVGPQLAARDQSHSNDEQIVEIIDTVLDHYDRTRGQVSDEGSHRPRPVAPE